jgi:starch phosphorylase
VPRRPLEASGTSGQKVAMNGGLNFSILDGWWIEGYNGENGFPSAN